MHSNLFLSLVYPLLALLIWKVSNFFATSLSKTCWYILYFYISSIIEWKLLNWIEKRDFFIFRSKCTFFYQFSLIDHFFLPSFLGLSAFSFSFSSMSLCICAFISSRRRSSSSCLLAISLKFLVILTSIQYHFLKYYRTILFSSSKAFFLSGSIFEFLMLWVLNENCWELRLIEKRVINIIFQVVSKWTKNEQVHFFLSVLLDWPLFSSFNFRPLKISLWTRRNEPIFSPT